MEHIPPTTPGAVKPVRNKRKTLIIASWLLFAMAVVFGGLFLKELWAYRQGEQAYTAIFEQAVVKPVGAMSPSSEAVSPVNHPIFNTSVRIVGEEPEPTQVPAEASAEAPAPTADEVDLKRITELYQIDLAQLKAINPEIIGWIVSEGTVINYPLVKGGDNDYYLFHLADRTYNKLGSIFVDARNKDDLSDETLVIYGHNMNDGSMFASFEDYKEQSYYEEHPNIYLFTEGKILRVELFAGYSVNVNDVTSLYFQFKSPTERDTFILQAKLRSFFKSPVEVEAGDQIVNFITCTDSWNDMRYMLLGRAVQLWP